MHVIGFMDKNKVTIWDIKNMEVRAKGVASALPNLIDTLRNAGNIPLVVSPRKLKAVAGAFSVPGIKVCSGKTALTWALLISVLSIKKAGMETSLSGPILGSSASFTDPVKNFPPGI